MDFWIIQLIGLIQLILSIIAIFQNDKKKLLFLFTCENIGYILIYLISRSFAGSALVFHATIRTITYYLLSKYKNKIPTPVFVIFLLSAFAIFVLSYNSLIDFIILINSILVIYISYQNNMNLLRWGYFTSGILLFTFNLFISAYISSINEFIFIISTLLSILKYNKKILVKID